VPFDNEMAKAAFDAFRRFGKGQAHPAQLNIVDVRSMRWRRRVPSPCSSRVATSIGRTFSLPSVDGQKWRRSLNGRFIAYQGNSVAVPRAASA
jgi:hypothetical protein